MTNNTHDMNYSIAAMKFKIASWELTYPLPKALLKMFFLFPGWDMLVP